MVRCTQRLTAPLLGRCSAQPAVNCEPADSTNAVVKRSACGLNVLGRGQRVRAEGWPGTAASRTWPSPSVSKSVPRHASSAATRRDCSPYAHHSRWSVACMSCQAAVLLASGATARGPSAAARACPLQSRTLSKRTVSITSLLLVSTSQLMRS